MGLHPKLPSFRGLQLPRVILLVIRDGVDGPLHAP